MEQRTRPKKKHWIFTLRRAGAALVRGHEQRLRCGRADTNRALERVGVLALSHVGARALERGPSVAVNRHQVEGRHGHEVGPTAVESCCRLEEQAAVVSGRVAVRAHVLEQLATQKATQKRRIVDAQSVGHNAVEVRSKRSRVGGLTTDEQHGEHDKASAHEQR